MIDITKTDNPFDVKDVTPDNKTFYPTELGGSCYMESFDSYPYWNLNWQYYDPWANPSEWDTVNTFDEYGFKEACDEYGSPIYGQGYLGFKNPENYDWDEYRTSQMASFNVSSGTMSFTFQAYNSQYGDMYFKVINNGSVIYEYQVPDYGSYDQWSGFTYIEHLPIQSGTVSFYIHTNNPHADCGLYMEEIILLEQAYELNVLSKPIDVRKYHRNMTIGLSTAWVGQAPCPTFNLMPRINNGTYLPTIYNLKNSATNIINLDLPENAYTLEFGLKYQNCQGISYTINSITVDMSDAAIVEEASLDTERVIENAEDLTQVETVIKTERQVAMLHNWNTINTERQVEDIKKHISHYFNSKKSLDYNYSTLTWDYDKNKYKVVCSVNEIVEQEESFLNYPFNGLRWAKEYCNYDESGMTIDILNKIVESRYAGRVGDSSSPKGVEQVAAFYAKPGAYLEYQSLFSARNDEDYISVRINKEEAHRTYFKDLYDPMEDVYVVSFSEHITLPQEGYNGTEDCLVEFIYCSNGSTKNDTDPVFTTQAGLVLEYAKVRYEEYNNYSWVTITPFDSSMYSDPIHLNLEAIGLENANITKIQYRDRNSSMTWHDFNGTIPPSRPVTEKENAYQVGSYIRFRLDKIDPNEQMYISDIHMDFDATRTGLAANVNLSTSRTIHACPNTSFTTSRSVSKEIINAPKTTRSITKSLEAEASTNRKTAINKETTILTEREVIKENNMKLDLDTLRKVHKSSINSLDSNRSLSKKTSFEADTKSIVVNTAEATIKTERIVESIAKVNRVIRTKRSLIVDTSNVLDAKLTIVKSASIGLDTERAVDNIIKIDKRIRTNRVVYITAASFITRLNANFRLEKGTLLLDSQEFN